MKLLKKLKNWIHKAWTDISGDLTTLYLRVKEDYGSYNKLKEELYKKWVDLSEVSAIYFRLRLLYKRKFGSFDPNYSFSSDEYQTVFEDKFEGDEFDTSKWRTSQAWGRVHPQWPFTYASKNCISVEDGNLVLINKYEPKDGIQWAGQPLEFEYHTTYKHGEISLKEKFVYGVYEIRCKVPKGDFAITAFWLASGNSIEIDMFEFFPKGNNKNTKEQKITVHWPIKDPKLFPKDRNMSPKDYKLSYDITEEFHTYTLIWEKDKMDFLFDGILMRSIINKKLLKVHNEPATLIIGNGVDQEPAEVNKELPNEPFYIDSVRILQKI